MMTIRWLIVLSLGLGMMGCGDQQAHAPQPEPTEADSPATEEPAAPAETASVTGTIFYLQRIALSPEAVITVKLQDVSLQDVAAVTITEQVIRPEGRQVPIPFELVYDPDQINPHHTYSVGVRIEESGRLRFINTSAYLVITGGNPTEVDVKVDMVP